MNRIKRALAGIKSPEPNFRPVPVDGTTYMVDERIRSGTFIARIKRGVDPEVARTIVRMDPRGADRRSA